MAKIRIENYYEVRPDDIGKVFLRIFGRTWSLIGVCGPILPQDIGKRIYQRGDIIQIENNEQRDARTGSR